MSRTTRKTARALADLRPSDMIQCMRCDTAQPAADAQRFHAHWVCAKCTLKLQSSAGQATTGDKN